MLAYVRSLTTPRIVLWCYLVYYLEVVVGYFDPSVRLWLSSVGISAIIGTALYLSTAHAGPNVTRLDRWQIFRFYLTPFCVSSFAALIKGRGFVLVLHPDLRGNVIAFGSIVLVVSLVKLVQRVDPSRNPAGLAG